MLRREMLECPLRAAAAVQQAAPVARAKLLVLHASTGGKRGTENLVSIVIGMLTPALPRRQHIRPAGAIAAVLGEAAIADPHPRAALARL